MERFVETVVLDAARLLRHSFIAIDVCLSIDVSEVASNGVCTGLELSRLKRYRQIRRRYLWLIAYTDLSKILSYRKPPSIGFRIKSLVRLLDRTTHADRYVQRRGRTRLYAVSPDTIPERTNERVQVGVFSRRRFCTDDADNTGARMTCEQIIDGTDRPRTS